MRRKLIWSGVMAGMLAGFVMALAIMTYMAAVGKSAWTNPNLIAVMWMGQDVANTGLSIATLVGFLTHMATSAIMGVVALPFIYRLAPWRTALAALAYALASYPVVFAAVLSWANPLMVRQTELIPMTVAHAIFGLVLGLSYPWLRRRFDPYSA